MPRIVDDKTWKHLTEELEAYRATGLSPEEVTKLRDYHNDPAPLPLDEDDRTATGLLEED